MVARLYTNENFPLAVVTELRRLGHDVLTVREAGQDDQGIDDTSALAFATAERRALLTLNRRDLIRLHRQDQFHAGIIACTEDADAIGQAGRIDAAIIAADELTGRLIRVHHPA